MTIRTLSLGGLPALLLLYPLVAFAQEPPELEPLADEQTAPAEEAAPPDEEPAEEAPAADEPPPAPPVPEQRPVKPPEPEPEPIPPPAPAPVAPEPEPVETPQPPASDTEPVMLVPPKPSQGHYLAFGLYGTGFTAYDDGRGQRSPSFGWGWGLRVGESVTDWFDLGIGFNYASTTSGDPGANASFGGLMLQAQLYASDHWFARGGVGFGAAFGEDPDDPEYDRGRYGEVYSVGTGYHLYLSNASQSGGWVVSPIANLELGTDADFFTTALWVGAEISWWSGFERDKLELPVDEAYDPTFER